MRAERDRANRDACLKSAAYTPDSSYGLWSIYVDDGGNNIYFSAQTNDLSSTLTTYLSAPISWTTNYFHFIALTYSATNTALYLDGVLATNGPGVTVYPGPDVLANGFIIGSDNNGPLSSRRNVQYRGDLQLPIEFQRCSDHLQLELHLLQDQSVEYGDVQHGFRAFKPVRFAKLL